MWAQGLDTCSATKDVHLWRWGSLEKHHQVNNGISILVLNFQGKWRTQESQLTAPSLYCSLWWPLQETSHSVWSFLREPAAYTPISLNNTLGQPWTVGANVFQYQPFGEVSDLEDEAGHHTKHYQGNKKSWQHEKIKLIRTYLRKRVY